MYVYHEFLYLILTRQVEGKGVGGWTQENDSKKCMGLFQYSIFPLSGGVWRTLTKLKIFIEKE
jgi:hypothetical protein